MEAMGVEITEERFCSPFREDERPTCSLKRMSGNGKLYFMDWATLSDPVDVFGLAMYVYGYGFSDTVDALWDLMEGYTPGKTPTVQVVAKNLSETKVKAAPREWLDSDYAWWNSFGIRKQELELFNTAPAQYVWLGEDLIYQFIPNMVQPAYIYNELDSLKVYFPFRKNYRFYHNNANALQGYIQLPVDGELCVITKSRKDVMLLHRYGIPAVAPQSESIVIGEEHLAELRERFKHVVALFDNDRAGILALRKYKALGVKPYMLSRHWSKDISDFYRKYGANRTERLIKATKWNLYHGGSSLSHFKL